MFVLSKIFWILVNPTTLFFLILFAGTILLFTRYRRTGRLVIAGLCLFVVAVDVIPVGDRMVVALENRFPANPPLPEKVQGIIVLGGTVNQKLTVARGQPSLSDGAERLTEFIGLGYRFPDAQLIFSGGSGSIIDDELKESMVARQFLEQMRFDTGRVIFESQSRNTLENATLSRALIGDRYREPWILVTSAFHMPRAVGVFRQQGWNVIPWPVDYQTDGSTTYRFTFAPGYGLQRLQRGLREWIGLAAYRLMGRTGSFFPGPLSDN